MYVPRGQIEPIYVLMVSLILVSKHFFVFYEENIEGSEIPQAPYYWQRPDLRAYPYWDRNWFPSRCSPPFLSAENVNCTRGQRVTPRCQHSLIA